MNTGKAFMLFSLMMFGTSAFARITPLTTLKQHGCIEKLETLATNFLRSHEVLLSIYEMQADPERKLDISSLALCMSEDLDRGSKAIRRVTTLCNNQGDVVELYTFGDLWCENELVLGIKSLTLAP